MCADLYMGRGSRSGIMEFVKLLKNWIPENNRFKNNVSTNNNSKFVVFINEIEPIKF